MQVILIQLFGLQCAVPQLAETGQPLLLYEPGVVPPERESDRRPGPPPAPASPPSASFPPSLAAPPNDRVSHETAGTSCGTSTSQMSGRPSNLSGLCSIRSMRSSLSSAVSSSYHSTFGV